MLHLVYSNDAPVDNGDADDVGNADEVPAVVVEAEAATDAEAEEARPSLSI